MMTFKFEPFVGTLPLRFGMKPAEVKAILGPPQRIIKTYFGNREDMRKTMNLGYELGNDKLQEIIFLPGTHVLFHGTDLFDVPDLIGFLCQFDPDPRISVGMVFFFNLGIRTTGFHNQDEGKVIAFGGNGLWTEKTCSRNEPLKWQRRFTGTRFGS